MGLSCYVFNLNLKIVYLTREKYKHDTISQKLHDSRFFVVGRPLQRRWAHHLRKGHPRVLQCINRHCTMKCQTFGSVGKLNTHTHTSWDRAPSRLNHCFLSLTHWSMGDMVINFIIYDLQTHIKDRYLEHFLWNYPDINVTRPHWWVVAIGSGKGLVPSGNWPFLEQT